MRWKYSNLSKPPPVFGDVPHDVGRLVAVRRISHLPELLRKPGEVSLQDWLQVTDCQGGPHSPSCYLVVCEGVEAMFAMVRSHATSSDPAEGKFLYTEMHDGVVDADAATGSPPGEQLLHLLAGGEQVERQRLVSAVDDFDGLFGRVHRHYGQDGTEYLILKRKVLHLYFTVSSLDPRLITIAI